MKRVGVSLWIIALLVVVYVASIGPVFCLQVKYCLIRSPEDRFAEAYLWPAWRAAGCSQMTHELLARYALLWFPLFGLDQWDLFRGSVGPELPPQ